MEELPEDQSDSLDCNFFIYHNSQLIFYFASVLKCSNFCIEQIFYDRILFCITSIYKFSIENILNFFLYYICWLNQYLIFWESWMNLPENKTKFSWSTQNSNSIFKRKKQHGNLVNHIEDGTKTKIFSIFLKLWKSSKNKSSCGY